MTVPQNMQALELANQIRLRRAMLRGEVVALGEAEGRALLSDMLSDGWEKTAQALGGARVTSVLSWVHNIGSHAAARYVAAVDASEFRLVRDLTVRQRCALAEVLLGGIPAVVAAEEEKELRDWADGRTEAAA